MSRVFDASQVGANLQTLITPSAAVYNNMQAWTYACWVYPTTSDAYSVLMIKDPLVSYARVLNLAALKVSAFTSYSSVPARSDSVETLVLNQWSHVAATFNNSGDKTVHLYINGLETTYSLQDIASGTIVDDSANGWIFGSDTFDGDSLDGRLAEVAIWNTALTGGQVATLAASTTGAAAVQAANLVGYWHLCGTASPEPDVTVNGDDAVVSSNPPTLGVNSPGFSACGGGGSSFAAMYMLQEQIENSQFMRKC